jgi:hypothetical protein
VVEAIPVNIKSSELLSLLFSTIEFNMNLLSIVNTPYIYVFVKYEQQNGGGFLLQRYLI